MSDEYTPSTDEVRLEYMAVRWRKSDIVSFDARAEFDRMIAEVERAAAEKAWWEACVRIADGESNLDIADTYQKQNPYLEEGTQ